MSCACCVLVRSKHQRKLCSAARVRLVVHVPPSRAGRGRTRCPRQASATSLKRCVESASSPTRPPPAPCPCPLPPAPCRLPARNRRRRAAALPSHHSAPLRVGGQRAFFVRVHAGPRVEKVVVRHTLLRLPPARQHDDQAAARVAADLQVAAGAGRRRRRAPGAPFLIAADRSAVVVCAHSGSRMSSESCAWLRC